MGTSLTEAEEKKLRGFSAHGVVFREKTPTGQAIGDCPFTGKEKKFYVNLKSLLWDSKTAGISGNFAAFLEARHSEYISGFKKSKRAQRALALDRGLALSAFRGWDVGFNGEHYYLPVRDQQGRYVDLRRYLLGSKSRTSPGCTNGLLGMARLTASRRSEVVYVCEGEWDAIALQWLLSKLGLPGVAVSVPGATTFKREWLGAFSGKRVQCLYDNDQAGESGELLARDRLKGVARDVKYINWPTSAPDGFDVRDWVSKGLCELGVPRACWTKLKSLFVERPRRTTSDNGSGPDQRPAVGPAKKLSKKSRLSPGDLVAGFRKWLLLRNPDCLSVVFGTCLANRLPGDPLWLFLVGPPGSLKSELCMALAGHQDTIHALSSLTPAALVSGAQMMGGEDPSLMPKLNEKVLVVKDFTTVLNMHPTTRDEIFGQLRDAYDGSFEKQFGNGLLRKYESHFGIIAGVTPAIDQFASLSGLGERFLKYRLEKNMRHEDEASRIKRAISNVSHENKMRENLQILSSRFLDREVDLNKLPALGEWEDRIIALAMLTARLRGVVAREKYHHQVQLSKASYEVGTRVGKQLTKLAIGLALFHQSKSVDKEAYRIVSEVALGSAPDKVEEVVKVIWKGTRKKGSAMGTKEISKAADRLTHSTVFRTLQDLQMLGLVKQVGAGSKYQWRLPPKLTRLIETSEVYKYVP